MPNINKNNPKVKRPIHFELVESKPGYPCWMCGKRYVSIDGDMCTWCIDGQAKIEKELLEGEG